MTTLAAAALLLVAVGLVAFAIVRRPQRGVLLLAALVPFDGLLLIAPTPPLVEGWKEGLVLATLGATVLAPPSSRGPAGRPPPDWWPALVGLLAVGVASAVAVGGTQALVGLKINYFYALLALVLWRCPFTARDRDLLVTILMVCGVLTSIVGLAQQVVGQQALRDLGYEYDTTIRTASGVLRSFSTFNQPFPFGLFLMLVLLIGIAVALTEPRRVRNLLFLLCVPLLVVAMIGSIVRAAIAATAVGLAFLAANRLRVLLHGVPPILVGALFIPASVYVALLSPQSLRERIEGWVAVAGQITGAPFGNGIGSTGSASEKSAAVAEGVTASAATSGYQPDNYYLKMLLELGPLGLWLFLLLLLSVFLVARRSEQQLRGPDRGLAAGIAATYLGAATASFVATYFEIFPLDVYFWITVGALTSLPSSPSTPSPSDRTAVVSRPTPAS